MSQRIEGVVAELGCGPVGSGRVGGAAGGGRERYGRAVAALRANRQRYVRLWAYYSNPMRPVGQITDASERPYRQAQEWGMPDRITGYRAGCSPLVDGVIVDKERKEVVIENDIAWRIDTTVDYLVGQMPRLHSLTKDAGRAEKISALASAIFECNGGVQLLQQMALIGAVYGFVDIAVTLDTQKLGELLAKVGKDAGTVAKDGENRERSAPGRTSTSSVESRHADVGKSADAAQTQQNIKRASGLATLADTGNTLADDTSAAGSITLPTGASEGALGAGEAASTGSRPLAATQMPILEIARLVSLQVVEPARALAITDSSDITRTFAFGQLYDIAGEPDTGITSAIWRLLGTGCRQHRAQVFELWSDRGWWRWRDDQLEASGGNTLGRIPVVHIQNTAVPFEYSGGSDVEPLIPLQDELNTRLSDRAHRIAVQSFRMYLGINTTTLKDNLPAPGRVWLEQQGADIRELGGDASCPAEETHIADVREAMDRASGVPPVAAGAIRNRIGNLTSAAALRITLMSLLARTDRKRALYGAGLKQVCELGLAWLDAAGLFHTTPEERAMEIHWANPLPENSSEKLAEAKLKLEVGVGKEVVLKELGY